MNPQNSPLNMGYRMNRFFVGSLRVQVQVFLDHILKQAKLVQKLNYMIVRLS